MLNVNDRVELTRDIQLNSRGDIASGANYKQIAYSLIENDFRGDARVTAAQDDSERFLPSGCFGSSFLALIGMLLHPFRKALISVEQLCQRLIGRNGI